MSQTRKEIADELTKEFESYCSKWNSMTTVIKEENYEARTCIYGSNSKIMVNLMKTRVPGAKLEQF